MDSIKQFAVNLLKASEKCAFGSLKDEVLRDAFILRLKDAQGKIRPALLTRDDLTFKQAIATAEMLESVSINAKLITGEIELVNKIGKENIFRSTTKCYGCGEVGHIRRVCKIAYPVCEFCKIPGHLEKACR